ncbi:MAG: ATP-binding protein [Planctomycetaceae bacterium]
MRTTMEGPHATRRMMWKYVLPPLLAITVTWIAASSATTYYIQWVETSHQQVLDENVASIRSAEELQQAVRRFRRVWSLDGSTEVTAPLVVTSLSDLRAASRSLNRSSITDVEKSHMEAIEELIRHIEESVNSPTSTGASDSVLSEQMTKWTGGVIDQAQILKGVNQRLIDDGVARRSRVRILITIYRNVLQVLGPLIGVWMGWRLSQRLQSWVGHLSVTLQQTDSQEIELGTLLIPADGVLSDLQHQAEAIVTRLKNAQLELNQSRAEVVRSERLAAVGQLAAGIAHELRNPMTSVKLLLQHAARRGGSSALKTEQLDLILDEISRMETTIGGLLDFSRQQPLRVTTHDFRQTLQRALTLVEARARHQKIRIQRHAPDHPVLLSGDIELLHQVLVNLCINAIESMPEGGTLTVSLSASSEDSPVQVSVSDTGPGIQQETLPKLFEPFTTTKERGTGLGLAVSRRIVAQHCGTLTGGNSPSGTGATFTMELPRHPEATGLLEGTT